MTTLTKLPDLGGLTKQESFKYSRLGQLATHDWPLAHRMTNARDRLGGVAFPFDVQGALKLVIVDGYLVPELSDLEKLPDGLTLSSFKSPISDKVADNPFWTFNSTAFGEGLALELAAHTVTSQPIQMVWVTSGRHLVMPRVQINLGRHGELSLIETHVGLAPHQGLTNAVHQADLGEGAVLRHYKVVLEPEQATHVASLAVTQQASSQLVAFYLALGGGLIRHEAKVTFQGPGAESVLNGLYVADGDSQMDNQTVVDHAVPHCVSHQLYRGILDGHANAIFSGRVYVRPDAQKTNAFQTNNNLLLSETASVNTKPQLEIDADDVKCSHGATIGRLDEQSLFYLRSRGLDPEMAKSLLSVAFASQVVDQIPIDSLRNQLNAWLFARFAKEQA